MLRAFIAIQLSDELRRQIGSVQEELRREVSGSGRTGRTGRIGWTNPNGIHLTLKFLGDIRESQIQPLQGVLQRAASSAQPFALEAHGVGAFPNSRAPRVIWVGLHGSDGDMEVLRRLQVAIEDGTAELGFQKEARAFTPHLTLARIRDRLEAGALDKVLAANQSRTVGGFTAVSVGLIKSELRPSGALYTTLVEVPFGGGV
ncbi:MAG TPA: RNA 2',3'-cyclic phosphodiesterase [Nitrospirales bacterium]|nr:RNA 2',3'-cyclic phosphodiesterase [Nitrospirales bacterium]